MDDNDQIYQAISRGLGRGSIADIINELKVAGYVIRNLPSPDDSPADQVLQAARDVAAQDTKGELPMSRIAITALALAWGNAVRAEWQDFVAANPELTAQAAVARELMRADGYTMEFEPVCGLPGVKPAVATVDGKECFCVDHSMVQVTPLSAIYVNKVREVMDAASRVSAAMAKEAAKHPPQWPIETAAGEVFNSIEEMEASPNEFVRGLAKSMRDVAAA